MSLREAERAIGTDEDLLAAGDESIHKQGLRGAGVHEGGGGGVNCYVMSVVPFSWDSFHRRITIRGKALSRVAKDLECIHSEQSTGGDGQYVPDPLFKLKFPPLAETPAP